jgi:hypothetical protein
MKYLLLATAFTSSFLIGYFTVSLFFPIRHVPAASTLSLPAFCDDVKQGWITTTNDLCK